MTSPSPKPRTAQSDIGPPDSALNDKPPPKSILEWHLRQRRRSDARALKALDKAIGAMQQYHSWKQIAFNAPPGSATAARAADETMKLARQAQGYLDVVRKALGADPDADEPPPVRHWDAGA
jgi:hypothetical protein